MRIMMGTCLAAALALAACGETPATVEFEPVADTSGAVSLTQSAEDAVAVAPSE